MQNWAPSQHHSALRQLQSTQMIDCQRLTKQYGTLCAVDDLSFRVEPGEVLGFLGPNGAGKTTTMRIIAGFLSPTSGRVNVCGHDVETEATAAKRRIGYLPEGAPSYPEMTPRSFLEFVAEVRAIPPAVRRRRLEEVFGLLHLESVIGQTIDTLSKGYRRRVGLAQAILHDPQVLILDEPINGLDPRAARDVQDRMRQAAAAGKTIFMSTHLLDMAEKVCTRVGIIHKGGLVATGTLAELRARTGENASLEEVFLKVTDEELTDLGATQEGPGEMPRT